ncbi:MAG TPA: PVC-type heme-binding CxxCH protein [Vicinamibacterales bacterium]|nr:PVC-type heme-binding CxxCH protein [Vicinamibacterales bacterium]
MRSTIRVLLAAVLTAAAAGPAAQNPAGAAVPVLTVPPGFTIERVAGPPLVNRPIVADFDEQGRLYVADSSGSNDRVEKQLADRPHRIVRLEDTDGDGRFDLSVVFADRMMLPEGTMWFDGSLYVAAPPSIWKLTDTDGDGIADRREEWFKGETLTGCANDLHGPYPGPDGWIYWTKGAFAQQTHTRAGKPPIVSRAAHIFRRRPGTPDIEVVMTGGMDNPVDVAFTPAGERILSATFLEHPQAGKRDALVHAIYGGVYGKPHAVLEGHARTGDLMPVMCQLGPAVPAGLTRYASSVFGREYRDNFFAAMFNLRKVTRHVLAPSGATFTSRDSDFVVSADRDFHPTDVIEDADGSLLVIDTGPWYKLCCPTSQLAKPETLGAIYRVRRTDAPAASDPRGRTLAWSVMSPSALVRLLDDPRPAVQNRALFQLSRHGADGVTALRRASAPVSSVIARRNAVWALARIDAATAREAVRAALGDRDDSVATAAAHVAGLWRDRAAVAALRGMLTKRPAGVQRAAAEALGRIGDAAAIPDLLASQAAGVDRVLEHSLTYALIEIGDAAALARAPAATPRARRAAIVALDQIDGNTLTADAVVALLDARDKELQEAAWWVVARHPDWGAALAGPLRGQLSQPKGDAADRERLQERLAAFSGTVAIQRMLAEVASAAGPAAARVMAMRVMADAVSPSTPAARRLREVPASWVAALQRALHDSSDDVVTQAIAVVRALPAGTSVATELQNALVQVARDPGRGRELRLQAMSAVSEASALTPDLFALVVSSLQAQESVPVRAAAADVVGRRPLTRDQLYALLPAVASASALELPRVLAAFDAASDEALGLALIGALERATSRAALRGDILRPRLSRYPETVKRAGEKLLASIDVAAASQAARLDALLSALPAGDIARGQLVFNGTRGGCLACHAIGYIGGRIGPDLTRIGQIRGDRDLLESIVYPSLSFARGYEPVVVRTASGEMLSGVQRADLNDEVVLADVAGKETRVARRTIAEIQPGTTSLMPSGFGDILTAQELADLVAFLRAAR